MKRLTPLAAATVLLLPLAACEDPRDVEVVQTGFRGTAMEHVANRNVIEDKLAEFEDVIPNLSPPTEAMRQGEPGPWENVQVLTDLSEAEFTRLMQAMTAWVSPEVGCNYCHVVDEDGAVDFASDDIYTKRVSRNMLRMNRYINGAWESHVGEAGATCLHCHQGQPVPQRVWYYDGRGDQPFRHYLDRDDIRVQGDAALASDTDNRVSIKQTEYAYSLMMSMSDALGVNCTYCHNSPRWADWEESPPQRVTALRGLRMTRDINLNFILPIGPDLPADRLGPMGDAPKVQCVTCHAGAYIPFYGGAPAEGWVHLYGSEADTLPTDPNEPYEYMTPDTAAAEATGEMATDRVDDGADGPVGGR